MQREPLAFHFDFISPYGFFAARRIEALAHRHGRTVAWHPMLLGVSVLKVMGLKPLLDTPLKGDYVRRDVLRHARREGVVLGRSLNAPAPNPLPPARAFCWARREWPHQEGAIAHAIYDALWVRGVDLDGPGSLAAVAWPPGVDGHAVEHGAAGPEAAAMLRASVEASLAAGVFGSPTVIVDGEPFWGFDRLPDVERWLADGGW